MGQMAEALQESPLGVLPSNTIKNPNAEITEITSMSSLTLDGSFIPHSLVYQEEEQEPETITEVVEIASSQSTPLVPPPETTPLSEPKPKENLEPNPHQTLIPYPSRLQKDKFQSLENPTGRAGYFIYSIDIVDSLSNRETNAFLSLDDSIPPGIDNGIYDSEGDILFLEELLNDDPIPDLPPPLHVFEIKETEKIKSSIEDPPDHDLKDLPPHLEYAFLE
ncbi:hypothetical protein Tco_1258986, partial [Tanacetum coccineum]